MTDVTRLKLALISLAAILVFAACSSAPVEPTPEPTATITSRVTEVTVDHILQDLFIRTREGFLDGIPVPSVRRAGALGDERLAPVLVELTMFAFRPDEVEALGNALHTLTGEDIPGDDFFGWYAWLGRNRDIVPPEGYARWKGDLYAVFDFRFRDFFYDGVKSDIPLAAIQWGGVPKDGIPPLEEPRFVSPDLADYLQLDERVFGVFINGEARAYPLRIMNSHELVNDVVGGRPVSLAYCTLCGSGILWDPIVNGESTTFGTSGFLFQSNKLMYDRQTETLWESLTGRPVVGELVGEHGALEMLPLTLTTWEEWLSAHPDTVVLSLEQGFNRRYANPDNPSAIYHEYFNSPGLMFPAFGAGSSELPDKTQVFGLIVGDAAKAYPIADVRSLEVINDVVGGGAVVVVGDAAAGAARAYERGDHTFARGSEPRTLRDGEGRVWNVLEDALTPPTDSGLTPLQRLPAHDAFWFGWASFYPDTELYSLAD